MIRSKRTAVGVLVAGLTVGALGATYVAGYARGRPGFELEALVPDILPRLTLRPREAPPDPPRRQREFQSIFLTLKAEVVGVPVERPGQGGGLASFWDHVLLITHEGRLFAADSSNEVFEVPGSTPSQGYGAYRRAGDSPELQQVDSGRTPMRYNDILHYTSDRGQGLAISYTEYSEGDACYRNTVATIDLEPDVRSPAEIQVRTGDWRIVFRTEPCLSLKSSYRGIEAHMAGGRLAFRPPSLLYLASGDYHWDGRYAPEAVAQRSDWDYGKVIEIDLASGEARTISSGHRNPQGIAIDVDGQLWVVEHGPRGGDELNRIVEGTDYGWPSVMLGTAYSGLPWPGARSIGRHDGFAEPTFAWLPSVAPSGLALIRAFHRYWDGDLVMATLKDQSLYRLRITDNRLRFAERIDVGRRIRYVLQHNDGRLVLWTDAKQLLFLRPVEQGAAEVRFLEERIAEAYDPPMERVIGEALYSCIQCHALVPDVHGAAPSLASVYGAPIAGTAFTGYSDALRSLSGRWTRESLLAFLDDPQAFAPGTGMPDLGIEDPAVLTAIVELLAALNDPAEPE